MNPADRGSWLADFALRRGRLYVKDTGADLALDRHLIGDGLVWMIYHLIVRARLSWLALRGVRGPAIWFTPAPPRPWYVIWSAMAWSGMRIARSPQKADATFAFEDTTWTKVDPPRLSPAFNFACEDISKTRVAEVFEAVFGYPLSLDPETWRGPAVEKGEVNGRHDGRLVQCPTSRLDGRSYQRLIDTQADGFVQDLRTPCVGGRPVVVWIKRKAPDGCFSIRNLRVTLHAADDVFSETEQAMIGRFCAAMGADWAGLDILREAKTGRLYIVDVNKTDVGPVVGLPLRDKIRSTALLAQALTRLLGEPGGGVSQDEI